jgi:GNAT superfamily N-acetyltransferase
MSKVIIRAAKKKDGKQLLHLINALADFEKLKRPTVTARKRLLRDAFGKRKRFDAYLAFLDVAAVGYAIVFETYSSFLAKPTLYLEDIFVLPEYRGKKIGLKLFKHCLAEAKRRKCGRMEWMVLDWNVNAIRFYEKLRAKQMKKWLLYRIVL